jgi:hypothetical protein
MPPSPPAAGYNPDQPDVLDSDATGKTGEMPVVSDFEQFKERVEEYLKNNPPKCTARQYADLSFFVNDGIWVLEGSEESHAKLSVIQSDVIGDVEILKCAGAVHYDHRT